MTPEVLESALKFLRYGNEGSHEAQELNRKLGIPNVYSINGKMVWEYKGEILTSPPPEWAAYNPEEEYRKKHSK